MGIALGLAAWLSGACGGQVTIDGMDAGPSDDGLAASLDGSQAMDASGRDRFVADTTPAVCLASASYGNPGALSGGTEVDLMATGAVVVWWGDLNQDPDEIVIELYAGWGVFTAGLRPGTFPLTGAELSYQTCGACVFVEADISAEGNVGQEYFATGGTLTLTSVSGRLTGSLSNVTFQHVLFDGKTGQMNPVGDGCQTSIGGLSFDAPIQDFDGGM